ncbi:hypothetical protein BJV78DRAFT_1278883 [Lactifluus subvellereus]|nr:hypothetical protein BJV78DRAFT_1278883 [Lactifluus subvellereus]
MTNWHDPVRVVADYIALIEFVHVLGGLYIWEIVLNLDYEYSIIMGKRKLTRTFPLYLGCRWCPLFVITGHFVGSDISHEINCQALVLMIFTFGYLSFLFSSALIVLRICALWEYNKAVIALASASWLANTASYIYSGVTSRGYWTGSICAIQHTEHTKISIFSTFITDLILLALMLIGLLRWQEARQRGGIWWLLYTQGLAWVVILTLAEVPPVVFIILDLNDPMNLMFLTPGLIIMSLGASRMYRGLADHPIANALPVTTIGGQRSGMSSWFAGPSHTSYSTESTHGARGALPRSGALPVVPHKTGSERGDSSWGGDVA